MANTPNLFSSFCISNLWIKCDYFLWRPISLVETCSIQTLKRCLYIISHHSVDNANLKGIIKAYLFLCKIVFAPLLASSLKNDSSLRAKLQLLARSLKAPKNCSIPSLSRCLRLNRMKLRFATFASRKNAKNSVVCLPLLS